MRRLLFILGPLLLFLSGCAAARPDGGAAFAPAEEERLVIYTSHREAVYAPIIKEFEDRTGIWVQMETGGTGELLDRIAAEAEAPVCDLLFGGGADSLQSRAELFEPYVSPLAEEVQPAFRCPDGSWTAFSSLPVVLIYNPMLVRTNPPEGWESLLDPVWRGRIAFAHPAVSGGSYTALATMLQALPGDGVLEAFYRSLDGQTLSGITAVVDEVADAVAEGSCTVGITVEPAALEAIEAGRNVALLYPREGTSAAPDGMAVVSGCAHGENARRFIDFALGGDVQRYLARSCRRRSVRKDLFAQEPETDGMVLIDYDLERAAAEREWVLSVWQSWEGVS